MIGTVFVKRYREPHRAAAARDHHAWLTSLNSGVRISELRSTTPAELVFEHLGGHHPGPGDLGVVAEALAQLHAAAHTRHLHAARLDAPFRTRCGLVITDFVTPRRAALHAMPAPVDGLAVALYKDANIRNFLLTEAGVAIIDFDDLTLAPFGYDLAKLVVSTAMTHGRPDLDEVEHALQTYNTHTRRACATTNCSTQQLQAYAEFHHRLTAPYLHRNGYRYPWPQVRPWATSARPALERPR